MNKRADYRHLLEWSLLSNAAFDTPLNVKRLIHFKMVPLFSKFSHENRAVSDGGASLDKIWPKAILLDFFGTVVQEDFVPIISPKSALFGALPMLNFVLKAWDHCLGSRKN